jgi:hypothetical protein
MGIFPGRYLTRYNLDEKTELGYIEDTSGF